MVRRLQDQVSFLRAGFGEQPAGKNPGQEGRRHAGLGGANI
jgi:hypothetical protein